MTAVQIARCQLFNWRSEKFHFRKSAFAFVEAVFLLFLCNVLYYLFKSNILKIGTLGGGGGGGELRAPRKYDQMIEDSGKGLFSDFSYTQLTSRQRLVRFGEII